MRELGHATRYSHDGEEITLDSLQSVCSGMNLTDAALEAMIGDADNNGDGRVSLSEFAALVRSPLPSDLVTEKARAYTSYSVSIS